MIPRVGPAGIAWLRLTIGALIFVALTRPPLRTLRRGDWPAILGLGAATGLLTVAFLAAIARIPLGTTVSIEFLGPLTAAALRSPNKRAAGWLVMALLGVVLLNQPWHGHLNLTGIAFAVLSGIGWGSYILLTHHIGDRLSGTSALSLTIPIAAAVAATIGIPEAAGHITLGILAEAAGLAVLNPVVPFTLEMQALRRMTPTAFGTLMALEPAIAALLGFVALHQTPSSIEIAGILIVVMAGAAAQRDASPGLGVSEARAGIGDTETKRTTPGPPASPNIPVIT